MLLPSAIKIAASKTCGASCTAKEPLHVSLKWGQLQNQTCMSNMLPALRRQSQVAIFPKNATYLGSLLAKCSFKVIFMLSKVDRQIFWSRNPQIYLYAPPTPSWWYQQEWSDPDHIHNLQADHCPSRRLSVIGRLVFLHAYPCRPPRGRPLNRSIGSDPQTHTSNMLGRGGGIEWRGWSG